MTMRLKKLIPFFAAALLFNSKIIAQVLCTRLYTTTIAGVDTAGYSGDCGPATAATLSNPTNVAVSKNGIVYFTDGGNARVRKIDSLGVISTIAGNGTAGFSGDGGAATAAQLNLPYGIAVDDTGNVYISDFNNYNIRKVNTSGIISTIAGNGSYIYGGDGGPATAAGFSPASIAISKKGEIYIADAGNLRIRKIDTLGIMSTIGGNGSSPFAGSGDGGLATDAPIGDPYGVAVDKYGNVYIACRAIHNVRKIDTAGIISIFAGVDSTGSTPGGFAGDGGLAVNASLCAPTAVAVDSSGNVYICDQLNHRVRKVDNAGIINTIAGYGATGAITINFNGFYGLSDTTELNRPVGVAVNEHGVIYVCDYLNELVRKLQDTTFFHPLHSRSAIIFVRRIVFDII